MEYASKGVGTAALTTGIIGTTGVALGMLNGNNCGNSGLLGGLFGNNCGNKVSALEAELAKVTAERYSDQVALAAQKETFNEFRKGDEKLAAVLAKVTDGFLQTGNAVSRLDKEVECIKATMAKDLEINDLKLKAVEERLSGAIALESERRLAGDNNLYCYVNATFVPGKLVMPIGNICPQPMPEFNSWTAPTAAAPTNVNITGNTQTK